MKKFIAKSYLAILPILIIGFYAWLFYDMGFKGAMTAIIVSILGGGLIIGMLYAFAISLETLKDEHNGKG